MAKNKTEKNEKNEDKKTYATFYESEMTKIGVSKDASRKEFSNAVRKKLGLSEIVSQRSSKRRELKLALGLSEDATQKEINEAMMKRLEK